MGQQNDGQSSLLAPVLKRAAVIMMTVRKKYDNGPLPGGELLFKHLPDEIRLLRMGSGINYQQQRAGPDNIAVAAQGIGRPENRQHLHST